MKKFQKNSLIVILILTLFSTNVFLLGDSIKRSEISNVQNAAPPNSSALKPILYDEVHSPKYAADNPQISWFFNEYGAQVHLMETGSIDYSLLREYSGLIIYNTDTLYTAEELSAIIQFMNRGGKIFIIVDNPAFTGVGAAQLLTECGFAVGGGMVDSDDSDSSSAGWVYYDAGNIADSPLTIGVSEYFAWYGSYFNLTPAGTKFLIYSDNDGTATVNHNPVATISRFGSGEMVCFLDTSILTNLTAVLDVGTVIVKDYGDHPQIVSNVMEWFNTPKEANPCLVTFSRGGYLTSTYGKDSATQNSPFLELWEFCDFNTQLNLSLDLLQQYYSLVLPNSYYEFTVEEKYALLEYVAQGGKILALADTSSNTGPGLKSFAESLGYDWGNPLTDTDDNIVGDGWVILENDNFHSETFFNGVDEIAYLAGGTFIHTPSDSIDLLTSDDDGTVNYQDHTLMSEYPYGKGSFVIMTDISPFIVGTITIESDLYYIHNYTNHDQFRVNVNNWLQINTHTLTVPNITSPNGGETFNSLFTIEWSEATDSYGEDVTYNIYLSADASNWTLIGSGVEDLSLNFDPSTVSPGDSYYIKVIAMSADLSTSDTSDNPFSIQSLGFLDKTLDSFTNSNNWLPMGAVAGIGFLLGALIFGLAGRKKK